MTKFICLLGCSIVGGVSAGKVVTEKGQLEQSCITCSKFTLRALSN